MSKGGALNSWIREFCSLVFTQTLQAFIYAIIITLIMATYSYTSGESNEYRENQFINTTSMGVINIFALTSIFKIEELARKVFGIQRSSMDPKSPMSSMAKLAFVSHFGRRLWDNGKKMVKGGLGTAKYFGSKRKNRRSRYKDLEGKVQSLKDVNEKIKKLENPEGSASDGQQSGVQSAAGVTDGAADVNLPGGVVGNGVLNVSTLNINANSVNMNGNKDNSDEAKLEKLNDKKAALEEAILQINKSYDDKDSENKKSLENSVHMALSGMAESVGAVLGGSLGAVIGGADGKNASQGMIVGMNVGDRVGQGAVDLGFGVGDIVVDIKKDSEVRKKLKDSKKNRETMERYITEVVEKNIKDRTEKLYENLQEEIEKSNKNTDKQLNNM